MLHECELQERQHCEHGHLGLWQETGALLAVVLAARSSLLVLECPCCTRLMLRISRALDAFGSCIGSHQHMADADRL